MSRERSVFFGVILLALAGAVTTSAIAKPKKDKADSSDKPDKTDKKVEDDSPKPTSKKSGESAVTPYDKLLSDANKAFSAGLAGGAFDDALAAYRKAITLDSNRPEAHLYMAGIFYHKGDFVAAAEALSTAVSRAKAEKRYVNWLGKALFMQATVLDAQLKGPEAKLAWQTYAEFAKDNPDKEFPKGSGDAPPMVVKVWPGTATDRVAKIDAYEKSKVDYAKVKELIIKRQKELGVVVKEVPAKK